MSSINKICFDAAIFLIFKKLIGCFFPICYLKKVYYQQRGINSFRGKLENMNALKVYGLFLCFEAPQNGIVNRVIFF